MPHILSNNSTFFRGKLLIPGKVYHETVKVFDDNIAIHNFKNPNKYTFLYVTIPLCAKKIVNGATYYSAFKFINKSIVDFSHFCNDMKYCLTKYPYIINHMYNPLPIYKKYVRESPNRGRQIKIHYKRYGRNKLRNLSICFD